MMRTFVVCAAVLAAPVAFSQGVVEELQPGDGDVTFVEDTGENPDLDALLGDPNSGLFDNFVNGTWQDPFALGIQPPSGSSTPSSPGYLGSGDSNGSLANMFAPGGSYALDAFRASAPGGFISAVEISPVPEPGTWTAIVAVSLAGVSTWARRRRNR